MSALPVPHRMDAPAHLECSACSTRHEAGRLQRLSPCCAAPLLARYDLDSLRERVTGSGAHRLFSPVASMWRYAALLPDGGRRGAVTLGEGWTPLLPAGRLGDDIGVRDLLLKDESKNPTGTFKARGMSTAVTAARALGVRSLRAPTAGNAGGALAAYAARAGIPATVAMPRDAPAANKAEVRAAGATLVEVDGLIGDCGAYLAEHHADAFDVSTLKEPYRLEGKKTMGLELWEQLDGVLPDVIVYPTGGGTGLIGIWKAFEELERLGLTGPERPRMVGVQATGCAPVVQAFHDGAEAATPWPKPTTIAGGLRVPAPVADRLILETLRASEGTAAAVEDDAIRDAMRSVARTTGLLVSPEAAATIPAVAFLADDGWLDRDETVVAFMTGTGLKHMDLF